MIFFRHLISFFDVTGAMWQKPTRVELNHQKFPRDDMAVFYIFLYALD